MTASTAQKAAAQPHNMPSTPPGASHEANIRYVRLRNLLSGGAAATVHTGDVK